MLSDSADVCLLLESLSSLRAVVETDENLASTYSATWNETHIFDAQSYELVQSERLEVLKMCDRLLSVISERAFAADSKLHHSSDAHNSIVVCERSVSLR